MKVCSKCNEQEVKSTSTYCQSCHNAYMRDWYKKRNTKEEDIIANRKYRMYSSAKKRAKKYNLDFDISTDDIEIPDICPALGIKISLTNKHIDNDSPTLDRVIPGKGYVKGNIVVISCKANRIKSDASVDEIKSVADWLNCLK